MQALKLIVPVDDIVTSDLSSPDAQVKTVASGQIPQDMMGVDIGPETVKLIKDAVKDAGTVVWNGPLGVFENPKFSKGTIEVAKALASSKAVTIIGGGDSAAAVEKAGVADKITHISTGGGASLEFLEGKSLPGIAILQDK
jgi:phosphoglycerate kinase